MMCFFFFFYVHVPVFSVCVILYSVSLVRFKGFGYTQFDACSESGLLLGRLGLTLDGCLGS